MRVLITGGAGFIGSHLTDALLARGDEVTIVDNFATARRDNLQQHDDLILVEDTIADPRVVPRLVGEREPNLIIHCAASYRDPENWTEDAAVNTLGTASVARAARDTQTRIIYFQTALCYGLNPAQQPVGLDHPLDPGASSYALSKTAGEHYISLSGADFVSFRLANVYGPRNISGPLPTFFQRLSDGRPCFVMDTRRDFVYIDDLVTCVLRAVDGTGHGIYHVSSGRDFAIKELFDEVINALGITLESPVDVRPRNPEDAPTILLDPSRTEEEFDWRATTPLSAGVERAVAYYQEFGVEETFTHLGGFES